PGFGLRRLVEIADERLDLRTKLIAEPRRIHRALEQRLDALDREVIVRELHHDLREDRDDRRPSLGRVLLKRVEERTKRWIGDERLCVLHEREDPWDVVVRWALEAKN